MYERDYAYTKVFSNSTLPDLLPRVRAALTAQGFGVLTEIDVQKTLHTKLGVERKPYLILGACNPKLAHMALQAEAPIGVFLPCNVNLFEGEQGEVVVQTPRPSALFGLVDNAAIAPLAQEIDGMLLAALEAI